jgi:hypothetical protein
MQSFILMPRAWSRGTFRPILTNAAGVMIQPTIPALKCETLLVHPSIGGKGFRISCVHNAKWMCWHQKEFRTEAAAVDVAEELLAFTENWILFFMEPPPPMLMDHFIRAHQKAEKRGDFL